MKSLSHLSIAILISTAACAQAAMAQEGNAPNERGNRFKFAPSVWKTESARIPNIPAEVHNVRPGSVPSKNSLLGGGDPSFFSKPAPPPAPFVQQQVTPRMMSTPVAARPSFSPAFGRPANPAQSIALQPSPAPMIPAAMSRPQAMQSPVGQARTAVAARRMNTNVAGRLASRPRRPQGLSAGPAVANYGTQGYQPGPFLPTQSAGGMSASTSVSGKVMHK